MTKVQDLNMNEISAVQGGECPVSLVAIVSVAIAASIFGYTVGDALFG